MSDGIPNSLTKDQDTATTDDCIYLSIYRVLLVQIAGTMSALFYHEAEMKQHGAEQSWHFDSNLQ
jgi:hypothetical protein